MPLFDLCVQTYDGTVIFRRKIFAAQPFRLFLRGSDFFLQLVDVANFQKDHYRADVLFFRRTLHFRIQQIKIELLVRFFMAPDNLLKRFVSQVRHFPPES